MRIRIFDTTLRDGEQSPGVALSPENKLNIAKKLDELGVDAIETGFPVISEGEQQAVKMITQENLSAELCGLARTNKRDIDAVVDCGLKYVHTFIATSDIHLQHKLHPELAPNRISFLHFHLYKIFLPGHIVYYPPPVGRQKYHFSQAEIAL